MEDHFLMFHDALSQWNQKEAQLHIKTRYPGFENRFIKPVGTTCAGTIYHDLPPRQLARERPGPRLVRLRGPRVRHVLQLRAGEALPLR